jgi:hypothetical protein
MGKGMSSLGKAAVVAASKPKPKPSVPAPGPVSGPGPVCNVDSDGHCFKKFKSKRDTTSNGLVDIE